MDTVKILGLISGLLIFTVYFTYLRQVVKGQSIPNPATWFIWVTVLGMNAVSYTMMVEDRAKAILPICVAVAALATFAFSLARGKFARLEKLEYVVLALAVIIGIFWKTTENARLANLFLQVILIISFVPTWVGLVTGKLKEGWPPWVLAVICYFFSIAALLIEWEGDWVQLAYPVVNGILGNGSVAVLALYYNHKRSKAELTTQ